VLTVKIYGANWCDDTKHTLEFLDKLGVAYEYVDISKYPQALEWVREHNDGQERLPTLDVAGQILSVPSEHELTQALRERGLMA
jgi:glutaredoxin